MVSLPPVSLSRAPDSPPAARIRRIGAATSIRCVLNFDELEASESTLTSSSSDRNSSLLARSVLSSSTVYQSPLSSPPCTPRGAAPIVAQKTRKFAPCALNFNELGTAESNSTSSSSDYSSNSTLLESPSAACFARNIRSESWSFDHSPPSDLSPTFSPLRSSSISTSSSSATSSSSRVSSSISASNSSDSIRSLSSSSSAAITSTVATSLLSPRGKKRSDSPSEDLRLDDLRRLSLSPSHFQSSLLKKGRIEDERKEENDDLENIKKKEAEENRLLEEIVTNIKRAPIQYKKVNGETGETKLVSVFTFEGIDYPIELLSDDGVMNQVWRFTTNVDIVIKGKSLKTAGLIIKTPREFKKTDQGKIKKGKKNNFKTELKETIRTFKIFSEASTKEKFNKLGLRIPDYYFTPLDTDLRTGEQYAVWIVEKMAESVQLEDWEHHPKAAASKPITRFEDLSLKNQKLLEVVRNNLSYILRNAHNLATDIICRLDFHTKNIMFDFAGNICYADGSARWDYEIDISEPIAHATTWLNDWAANNPSIFSYLRTSETSVEE